MNAMTCTEVEVQLDLLAAEECDSQLREAVERHLQHCPACAATYAESQRLLGLLTLHLDTAGPQRLWERIEREERRKRHRGVVLPFARRAAALAALLLVTWGLGMFLPRLASDGGGVSGLQLAALVMRDQHEELLPRSARLVREVVVAADVQQRGEAFRHALDEARSQGKLPPPIALPLELELKNTGPRPLEVRFGDPPSELVLDVEGNGVLRIPAPGASEPEFLKPRMLRLAPGETYVFRIDRLIAGGRGRLQYIYLTESGEYPLTAHLRVLVNGSVATLTSKPIRIKVENRER